MLYILTFNNNPTHNCYNFVDRHNIIYNTMTRLAIIDNLPPFTFSWTDTTPQKSRGNLGIDEIYPNMIDGRQLFERAVQYVTQVLVEEFRDLDEKLEK